MIVRSQYSDVSNEDLRVFTQSRKVGRLVTVSPTRRPHLGVFPFVPTAGTFEMHLRRDDEQTRDVLADSTCIFELDEELSTIPSYWEHQSNASLADQYYRCVVFECRVVVELDPHAITAHLVRILARYQPDGGYRPVATSDSLYAPMISQLALLVLEPIDRHVKFKVGQQRPPSMRRAIASHLRNRGTNLDLRTAAIIEQTLCCS